MAKPTDIRRCTLPSVPVDAGLRCAACQEQLFDASVHTADEVDALTRAGRCGRWVLDRAGRALVAAVVLTANAQAAELEVVVQDADGQPIPTAVVRVPAVTDERLRVDAEGAWRGEAVPRDGAEPVALPEGVVRLEVSAPGYKNLEVDVKLRKRRARRVTLVLASLSLDLDLDPVDVPIVFGRDKPIE